MGFRGAGTEGRELRLDMLAGFWLASLGSDVATEMGVLWF